MSPCDPLPSQASSFDFTLDSLFSTFTYRDQSQTRVRQFNSVVQFNRETKLYLSSDVQDWPELISAKIKGMLEMKFH
jgi:hypothetical protein